MKKLKVWQGWTCVAVLAVLLPATWYSVKSAPPNRFLRDITPENVTGISFMMENGVYGEDVIRLQTGTTDTDVIQEILSQLKQERFYYDASGRTGAMGEIMLIFIDTVDHANVMLQLKKSEFGGGDGTVTIDYGGAKYFLQRFSEKKELDLYNSLFQLASKLPQPQASEYMQAWDDVVSEQQIHGQSGVDLSTVAKVYDYADVVVVGRADTISISQYTTGRAFPYSNVYFYCEETLKGTHAEDITFSFSGGLVPAAEFWKNDPTSKKEGAKPNFSEEEMNTGFVHIQTTERPPFKEGDRYVVFLAQEKDGSLSVLGSDYSVLTVDENTIADYEGKTYNAIG